MMSIYCVIFFIATIIFATKESRAIRLFEKVSTSSAVYTINNFIYALEGMISSSKNKSVTNHIFKDLAREAMVKMGLPMERCVPVCAMQITSSEDGLCAITTPQSIILNENRMNEWSYAVCRFILFHEVAHLKYHGGLTDPLLGAVIFAGIMTTLAKCMINDVSEFGQLCMYQVGIAIPLSYALIKIFSFIAEGHADRKAIQYLQCTNCVKEYVKFAQTTFSWKGYLTKNECIEWDKKYNPRGTLCKYHKTKLKQ